MMNTFRRFLSGALVALASVTTLYAQAALNSTTLTQAVSGGRGVSATQTISVASVTNIVVGDTLFVPTTKEAMLVNAITGLQLTVRRGYDGTTAQAAATGVTVYTGSATKWTSTDPVGPCTGSTVSQGVLPLINVRNGNIWNCAATTTGFQWSAWNAVPTVYTMPRTVVAGIAYTILPTDHTIVLSTTGLSANVKSFTLPSHVGLAGKQLVIVDESGGLTATTRIILVGTINGTSTLVANVIEMKTAYQSVGLQAGSGGWFTLWCWGAGAATVTGGMQLCR